MNARRNTRWGRSFFPRTKTGKRQARYLGGTAIGVFSLLIVSTFALSGSQKIALSSPQVAAVVSSALVAMANGDRAENGIALLTIDPKLVAAAQAKANDMAARGYFAHIAPDGTDPWHWFREAGYDFDYAGENLAVDFSDSGDVERAWMDSPTHRGNILDPRFTHIGIASAQGMYQGRLTTFVVEEFGTPTARTGSKRIVSTIPAEPQTPAFAQGAHVVSAVDPAVTAQIAQDRGSSIPWWGYLLAYPREALRYAYYIIGMLILGALALETGFEIRWHHLRHATVAGVMLGTMCILFVVADYLFFAEPVLAAVGAR